MGGCVVGATWVEAVGVEPTRVEVFGVGLGWRLLEQRPSEQRWLWWT